MNTAIEVVVDLVSPEYHPLAKIAKDIAAGAVLVASVGTAVMGYLILSHHIFPAYKEVLGMIGPSTDRGTLVAILIVAIAVIIIKTRTRRGTPLEGGLPSGHAALAFSMATAISFNTKDPMVSLMTIALATMVCHSRLLLNIHSMREVVAGALTGAAITLIVLFLFRFVG